MTPTTAATPIKDLIKPIYFDHHATTPVDPRVLESMLPFFSEDFGNAESAQHAYGWSAKSAVERSRSQVASLIGAEASEILFTSGATESIHQAILGFLEQFGFGRPDISMSKDAAPTSGPKALDACHIITANSEHKATLEVFKRAEKLGVEVTILAVDECGRITRAQVEAALRPHTRLVSLMHANNEIGTIHPIEEIGPMLFARGIALHVDAAQTCGRVPIDVKKMGIALLSISSHKLYGPKGVGALFIRKSPKVHISPVFPGGGQERGLRGGTHNVPGIVGLGRACELAVQEMNAECARLKGLRDQLIHAVVDRFPKHVRLNGDPEARLCHNVSFTIQGVDPDILMTALQPFAYSSGSACSSLVGSHVLAAIGIDTRDLKTMTTRFGLGHSNHPEQVAGLISVLSGVLEKLS